LAEAMIEWIDDRFGRPAAWTAAIGAVLVLTVGTIAVGVLLLR
jgi:hypothetical protein